MVGVKPLTLDEADQLCEEWQQKHDDYFPGFTGLWFIQNGRDSELDETLISDVYYVATRSWREDARILWRTPRAWLGRIKSHSDSLNGTQTGEMKHRVDL